MTMTMLGWALALALGYYLLSFAVVKLSINLHKRHQAHIDQLRSHAKRQMRHLIRTQGLTAREAKAKVLVDPEPVPGARFIHGWAARITRRGRHPLSIAHHTAVSSTS